MKLFLLAAGGGAIGAGLRYAVNEAFAASRPALNAGVMVFPWPTLAVNVVGCFLMGVLFVAVGERFSGDPAVRTFLGTGILGGFTTFSAFSLDAFTLHVNRGPDLALLYVLVSVVGSIAGLILGLAITRWALQ